jgi:hypothetical protein
MISKKTILHPFRKAVKAMILQWISSGYQQPRATVPHSSRGLPEEERLEALSDPSDESGKSDGETHPHP